MWQVYILVISRSLVGLFFLFSLSCLHTFDQNLSCHFGLGSDFLSNLPFSYLKCSPLVSFLLMSFPFRWTGIWPVQFSSVAQCIRLFATPWTAARHASLSITNSRSPGKPMSIELVMPSSHLILCHPLLLLPSIFPSIRVFSNESALCIRWPMYWSFSFNIRPSNEHPGLISFRMDWLDLLAVQGTLKSLLHRHSSKASILWRSAFFVVQLSHPYMTTGKTIALTRRTFVDKWCLYFLICCLGWS